MGPATPGPSILPCTTMRCYWRGRCGLASVSRGLRPRCRPVPRRFTPAGFRSIWHAADGPLPQQRLVAQTLPPVSQVAAYRCEAGAVEILQVCAARRSLLEAPPVGRSSTLAFGKLADTLNNGIDNSWVRIPARHSADCPGRGPAMISSIGLRDKHRRRGQGKR